MYIIFRDINLNASGNWVGNNLNAHQSKRINETFYFRFSILVIKQLFRRENFKPGPEWNTDNQLYIVVCYILYYPSVRIFFISCGLTVLSFVHGSIILLFSHLLVNCRKPCQLIWLLWEIRAINLPFFQYFLFILFLKVC